MFRSLAQALGNTSVKLKLALGFGLVLLLTLTITLTGWHGLDNMIERSEKLTAVGQLSNTTKDLHAERITYRGANTPEAAEAVVKRVNQLEAQLKALHAMMDNNGNLTLLSEQSESVRSFERTFDELTKILKDRGEVRKQLDQQSTQAMQTVAQVETDVLKAVSQEQDSSERLDEFTNISQLRQQIQTARYQVQAYTFSRQEADELAAVAAIDEALKEVGQIAEDQANAAINGLQQANETLQRYRDKLGEFKDLQVKVEAAHEAMEALGEKLLAGSNELSSRLTTQRDSEAAR
ncbi:MAG: methyl-accepting chemotaxis protein [Pseudomonas sp.]|nr:methyl-accepting chemotaxis protein [Pseudomonas sp.]